MHIKILRMVLLIIMSFTLSACQATKDQPDSVQQKAINELLEDNPPPLSADSFEKAFELASNSEKSGEVDKALYFYIQCLEFQPQNADVLFRIANIHEQKGNDVIALRAYREALLYDETLIDAHQSIGIIEVQNGNFDSGRPHLLQAISRDQIRLSNYEAKQQFGYLVPDGESPLEAYNLAGVIEDMDRNFDLARTYYQLALNVNNKSANILSNLGYSYYLTGDLVKAERYFKKALHFNNKFNKGWTNLGLVYIRKGQYDRAIKTFNQVMPEHDSYNDLGYFVMLEGRLDEAEYFFKKAISLSSRYFEKANINLEKVQLKKQEVAQANSVILGATQSEKIGQKKRIELNDNAEIFGVSTAAKESETKRLIVHPLATNEKQNKIDSDEPITRKADFEPETPNSQGEIQNEAIVASSHEDERGDGSQEEFINEDISEIAVKGKVVDPTGADETLVTDELKVVDNQERELRDRLYDVDKIDSIPIDKSILVRPSEVVAKDNIKDSIESIDPKKAQKSLLKEKAQSMELATSLDKTETEPALTVEEIDDRAAEMALMASAEETVEVFDLQKIRVLLKKEEQSKRLKESNVVVTAAAGPKTPPSNNDSQGTSTDEIELEPIHIENLIEEPTEINIEDAETVEFQNTSETFSAKPGPVLEPISNEQSLPQSPIKPERINSKKEETKQGQNLQ